MKGIRNPVKDVIDLLFPPICPLCEERLSEGICDICWREIIGNILVEPKLYYGFKVYSLLKYEGKVKEAIGRMKYSGMRELAVFFSSSLAEYLRDEKVDLIVPVPLHPARIRERGFSQTHLIAKALGKELGVPVKKVIFRTRYTKPQALLGAKDRAKNIEGAFSYLHRVEGENIVLVDDVITTGGTFYNAALALINAGASKVIGATLAAAG